MAQVMKYHIMDKVKSYGQSYKREGQHHLRIKKPFHVKYLPLKYSATFTRLISTGTSTSGPITAAKAAPELIPNTATATAIASSKLLLAAVNDNVAVLA